MKLKLNDDGYAEVKDGKPVYVDDGGKEHTFDAPAMRSSFDKLNEKLTSAEKERDEAKGVLEKFGDTDPEKAQEALKTLKNLDDKKLIDAGEVERVKGETAAAYEKRLKELQERADGMEKQYASEKLSNAFAASKFAKEKIAVPPDMLQRTFSEHFEYKDGRIMPKDANGNPIYSDSNPGDVASFDEALEKIVQQYPHRDSILKGTGNSGSGAQGVDGDTGARIVSRKYFESQPAGKQAELAKSMNEGKVKLES